MEPVKLPRDSIKVGTRFRQDYGDIDELAESIAEIGLIQPVVVDADRNLVAGGRRFQAMTQLGWADIPVVLAPNCGDERTLRMMELEENVRRKDMTWQEKVMCIAEIHRLKTVETAAEGDKWTQAHTGALLNVSTGNVSYCLTIAKELKKAKSPIADAESLTEAIRTLLKLKEEEAHRRLVAMTMPSQTHRPPPPGQTTLDVLENMVPGEASIAEYSSITEENSLGSPDGERCVACEGEGVSSKGTVCPICKGTGGGQAQQGGVITVPISDMCRLGDSTELLKQGDALYDHIITDPPFAIDMEMLDQDDGRQAFLGLEDTKAEHVVEDNLKLLHWFIPRAYHLLKDAGFLVMWCDITHFMWLMELGEKSGFRVQRWPLVWVKQHRCVNRAAGSNFTKSVEFAIVMSKGVAALSRPQATCHYMCTRDSAKQFEHPFAKPVELWQWVIEAVALPGQTILDPFAGTGSCVFAAAKAGFKPRGIELVEKHYNKMVHEMKEAYKVWMQPKSVEFV